MIIGIGTDIVQVQRIQSVYIKLGEKFAQRILSATEFQLFKQKDQSIPFLAKRFAAKEATSKALGTGIGLISWHDIEVSNNNAGAPILTLTGKAKDRLSALGGTSAIISLSDEKDYAVAFVVVS